MNLSLLLLLLLRLLLLPLPLREHASMSCEPCLQTSSGRQRGRQQLANINEP